MSKPRVLEHSEIMMKSSNLFLGAAGISALLIGAASAESRDYTFPAFDKIDISAGVELVAEVGGEQTVEVVTENGDFSDFKIEVRNGELMATRKHSRLQWHRQKSDYKIIVSVSNLRSIEASSGSWGEIENIDTGDFNIDLSSGARIELDGECGSCTIDLSSGASLEAEELSCARANIDVSSGGHGVISVSQSVVADASSGGHMRVYGNPEQVSVEKSSGGHIKIVK